MGSLTPSTLIWSNMSFVTKTKKGILAFLNQPISFLFFILDKLYDEIFLPLVGRIWRFEGILRGGVIGSGLFFGRPILKFFPGSKVILEKGCMLVSNQRRCSSGNLYGPCKIQTLTPKASIFVGQGVGLNGTSIVSRSGSISIGKHTIVGPNCVIIDSPFHRLWPPEQRLIYPDSDLDQDVKIGTNCWIASGCVILPGSKIGNNSVVGARSVVSGEIPPNCLAIGRPAKVIRRLDKE